MVARTALPMASRAAPRKKADCTHAQRRSSRDTICGAFHATCGISAELPVKPRAMSTERPASHTRAYSSQSGSVPS